MSLLDLQKNGGCERTRAHVDEGVVDQHQLVEVKLVGEPLPFGLVEDPLVIVVPEETRADSERAATKPTVIRDRRLHVGVCVGGAGHPEKCQNRGSPQNIPLEKTPEMFHLFTSTRLSGDEAEVQPGQTGGRSFSHKLWISPLSGF